MLSFEMLLLFHYLILDTFWLDITICCQMSRHATEPANIMKYIKIAAKLPEKQVRDVAMKCQLMAVSTHLNIYMI